MKNEYVVKIEGKEWQEYIEKAFNKIKKDVNIPGFRKGYVTLEVFIKNKGIESLFMDAVDIALPSSYDKLLKDKDIVPAASPKADVKNVNEEFVELSFEIVTKPEIKLGKYKDLGIKKEDVKVSKEEIEDQIKKTLEKFVEVKTSEKDTLENGLTSVIDFEGFLDNVPFEGGKGENYSLEIGSNTFIPGFEEQLVGMKKGEEKDVKVTFPNEYPSEELKGKEVIFKVKLNDIKEKVLPKMDTTFFKDLNMDGIDSEDKLKNEIETSIKTQKEVNIENEYLDKLLEEIKKNSTFTVPEEMIDDEIERMIKEFGHNLEMQGFNIKSYLEMINKTEEELREQMKVEASNRVSYRLLLEEIVKTEKIEIEEKDVEQEIINLSKKYNMEKDEFVKAFGGKEFVKYDMQVRKAIELIK